MSLVAYKFKIKNYSIMSLFWFFYIHSIENFFFVPNSFIIFTNFINNYLISNSFIFLANKKILSKFLKQKKRFRKYLIFANFKIKFTRLFYYYQKSRLNFKKISNKSSSENIYLNFNTYFFLNRKNFKRKWYPLTGKAISKLDISIRDKKLWVRKLLRFKLKLKYKFLKKINKIPKKTKRFKSKSNNLKLMQATRSTLKEYFFSKHLYRSKLNSFSFKRLKFFIRFMKFKFPLNNTRHVHHKPYMFLNAIYNPLKKPQPPLKHIFKLFKSHKRLFKHLKRNNYRKKSWLRLWFFSFSSYKKESPKVMKKFILKYKKKNKKFRKLTKLLFIQKHLLPNSSTLFNIDFNSYSRNYFFKSWTINFTKQFYKTSKKKKFVYKIKAFLNKIINKKYKSYKSFSLLNRIFLFSKRFYLKGFYRIMFVSRLKKKNKFKSINFFYRLFLWLIIIKNENRLSNFEELKLFKFCSVKTRTFSKNQSYNNLLLKKNFFWKNSLTFYLSSFIEIDKPSLITKKIVSTKETPSIKVKSSQTVFSNKLLLLPRHKTKFITKLTGFLFLTNTLFVSYACKRRNRLYAIKGCMYTFAKNNDMKKHLLNKAKKLKRLVTIKFYFKKKKTLKWKKYYNPTYREFNFVSSNSNFEFNLPISNIKAMLWNYLPNSSPLLDKGFIKRRKFNKKKKHKKEMTPLKFKPGLSRRWRKARRVLLESLNLNFRYQHRLTKFILTYKKIIHKNFIPSLEMRFFNVLVRSRLMLDKNHAIDCIEHGFVFINGFICHNPYFQLLKNDFFQFIVSFKYYIIFRWFVNQSIKFRNRIKKISWKNKQRNREDDKQHKFNLQKSVLPHKYLLLDVAKYLEVDFLSLSAFIIYDPFLWNDFNKFDILEIKFGIINVFNWKYIT